MSENDGNGLKMAKSRLVARGFQERVGDEAVDAPTATRDSLRVAAHVAVHKGWTLRSIDIKCAFLQSAE